MKSKKLLLLLIAALAFAGACNKDDDDLLNGIDINEPPVKTERQKILEDYIENYVGSEVTDFTWTGDVSICYAGEESAEATAKTLQRINYFRRMAGLNDDIIFDPVLNAKCQKAALMIRANNSLSHSPPTTWECYTEDGAQACANSNLARGPVNNSSYSVSRYIRDAGDHNTAVGHRRWILFSRAKIMGTGSTPTSNALWVLGNGGNPLPSNMPDFVAWPPKGYVPAPIVYPRWSFSVPAADFTNAEVSMTDANNQTVALDVIHRNGNTGDRSIVWEPENIILNSTEDVVYNVSITNVMLSGTEKDYNYQVKIIQP